jgi:CRP-like cAMP-binding protein
VCCGSCSSRGERGLVAIVIERDDFLRLVDEHPAMRLEVLMAFTQRIRRTGGTAPSD